jgi:hypothetical protein
MRVLSFQAAKRRGERMELLKLLDFKGPHGHSEEVRQVRWSRHFYGGSASSDAARARSKFPPNYLGSLVLSLSVADKSLRLWDTRDRNNSVERPIHCELFKDSAMVEFDLNHSVLAGYTLKKDEIFLFEVSEKGLKPVSSLKTKTQIRKLAWLKDDDCEGKVLF